MQAYLYGVVDTTDGFSLRIERFAQGDNCLSLIGRCESTQKFCLIGLAGTLFVCGFHTMKLLCNCNEDRLLAYQN